MNRKLIFQLSLFGLFMAIATVFWIPWNIELLCWFVIFIICAIIIARKCSGKYFFHGFLVGLLNSVWRITVHILFFDKYISGHPEELDLMSKLPMPYSPRIDMLMTGPFIGMVFGIVLGLFCVVAAARLKHRIN